MAMQANAMLMPISTQSRLFQTQEEDLYTNKHINILTNGDKMFRSNASSCSNMTTVLNNYQRSAIKWPIDAYVFYFAYILVTQ